MAVRLLLLCLLFRSSWLTVEGDRRLGAAGVLHRRGVRVVVAVRVGVAGGVPLGKSPGRPGAPARLLRLARSRSGDWFWPFGLLQLVSKELVVAADELGAWVFGSLTRQPQRLSQQSPCLRKQANRKRPRR